MKKNPLGKKIKFKFSYDPDLLFFISRKQQRENKNINLKMYGYDVWNIYELSWLDKNGKPEVRRARISYSCNSENIIESKSLKLYLNSFCMTKFNNEDEVINCIKNDLLNGLKTDYFDIKLFNYKKLPKYTKIKCDYDSLELSINKYNRDPSLLIIENCKKRKFKLVTNLLKTNCPITGQPDWATIIVEYISNKKIDEKSFLKYIISFREEKEFHETCCELIFSDIYTLVNPEDLTVKCYFTRRGGIDINPIRSKNKIDDNDYIHLWRQ